uniref:Putative truncated transposase B n=1 Tax=Citrobacter freundii TaxID=546 RepID=A0A1B3ISJ9_CITFR|nr:putative truncated transposase B [Citrobacter freundii]
MCNGNLKNFSNAGGWSMAFYGFAASLATPSTGSDAQWNENSR